jgi:hypothetical protein
VGQDSQVLEWVDCDSKLSKTDINALLTAAKKDEEDLKDRIFWGAWRWTISAGARIAP